LPLHQSLPTEESLIDVTCSSDRIASGSALDDGANPYLGGGASGDLAPMASDLLSSDLLASANTLFGSTPTTTSRDRGVKYDRPMDPKDEDSVEEVMEMQVTKSEQEDEAQGEEGVSDVKRAQEASRPASESAVDSFVSGGLAPSRSFSLSASPSPSLALRVGVSDTKEVVNGPEKYTAYIVTCTLGVSCGQESTSLQFPSLFSFFFFSPLFFLSMHVHCFVYFIFFSYLRISHHIHIKYFFPRFLFA